MTRVLLSDFQLPNVGYAQCAVTVYLSDANGLPTAVKATLYDSLTGPGTLFNPQDFTSEGALPQPTYIDAPVVPMVTGAHAASQTLGVVCPPGGARGDWATATLYLPGDIVVDGADGTATKDIYAVVNLHQSGVWATDAANAAKLKLVLDVSALNIAPDATTVVKGKAALATAAEYLTGTDAAKIVTPADAAALWAAGTDNAGGATITLGNGGSFNLITSTTAITAFAFTTDKAGRKARITFKTIRTLTNNAAIAIPGAASVTTAVGDSCEVESLGGGNFRVNDYTKADGTPLVGAGTVLIGSARNLVVKSNASTPNSKVDLSADEILLKDASGNPKLFSAVAVTIDITVSGANGLDTGAEASGTWYYVWGVGKSDGTFAGLFSASSTAPTLPSGYTYKALLGVVRNDGSSNFIKFHQADRDVETAPVVAITGTAVSVAGTLQTLSISSIVPPNAKRCHGYMGYGGSGPGDMAVAGDANGVGRRQYGADQTAGSVLDGIYGAGSFIKVPLITAQTIFWTAFDTSTNPVIKITGYEI